VSRKYKDDPNELESFIDFLKGLFVLDPALRWNAKMALKHPFITREKYMNKFIPYRQDVSIVNTSIDASTSKIMEQNRSYNSLAVDYNYNNNDFFNQSCGSFQSNPIDNIFDYQEIPIHNLNAKILRNPVPQAQLLNFNCNKVTKNKFDNPGHNSFMMASFEKLSNNNSFTNNDYKYGYSPYGSSNKKPKNPNAKQNQMLKTKKKKSYKSKFDNKTSYLTPTAYGAKKISDKGNFAL